MRPKKGDRLICTGPYAPEVIAAGAQYPPGTVVTTHYRQEFRDPYVTVLLDGDEEHYADWPIAKTLPAPPRKDPE